MTSIEPSAAKCGNAAMSVEADNASDEIVAERRNLPLRYRRFEMRQRGDVHADGVGVAEQSAPVRRNGDKDLSQATCWIAAARKSSQRSPRARMRPWALAATCRKASGGD